MPVTGIVIIFPLATRSFGAALAWTGAQILAAGSLAALVYLLAFLLPSGLELWLRARFLEGAISAFDFFLGSAWLTAILRDLLGFWLLSAAALSLLGVCALGVAFLLSRLKA